MNYGLRENEKRHSKIDRGLKIQLNVCFRPQNLSGRLFICTANLQIRSAVRSLPDRLFIRKPANSPYAYNLRTLEKLSFLKKLSFRKSLIFRYLCVT